MGFQGIQGLLSSNVLQQLVGGAVGDSSKDKASQFLTGVLPQSLGALQLLQKAPAAGALLEGAGSALNTATSAIPGIGAAATGATGFLGMGAGIFGGIMGAADLIMNWGKSTPAGGAASGAALGATIGSIFPGIGTVIGGALGGNVGGLFGSIKTGKHKDQKVRDSVRGLLVQEQVIDSSNKLTLANGTQYDMGADGKPRAELGGRRPYEIDTKNPLAKYAISWLNPVMDLLSGGNQKVKSDFIGYFTNAALSNATSLDDVRKNVNTFIAKFKLTDESLAEVITKSAEAGKLDQQTAAAYLNGINERKDVSFMGEQQTPTAGV